MRTFQLCSGRAARLIVPVLVMALALAGAAAAQTDDTQTDAARAKRRIFLPVAAGNPLPPPLNCDLPNTSYTSLSIAGEPLSVNPDTHPNLNLGVCGYAEVDAPLRPVELGPVHDPRAPQLPGMFGDRRTPAFTNAYQRYRWDANRNCLNDYSSCLLYTSDSPETRYPTASPMICRTIPAATSGASSSSRWLLSTS